MVVSDIPGSVIKKKSPVLQVLEIFEISIFWVFEFFRPPKANSNRSNRPTYH